MNVNIQVHPAADAELQRTREWYTAISLVLIRRFVDALEKAFILIRSYPESGAIICRLDSATIRRVRVAAFPYSVYYLRLLPTNGIDNSIDLQVIGIRHDSQRDVEWRQRLN